MSHIYNKRVPTCHPNAPITTLIPLLVFRQHTLHSMDDEPSDVLELGPAEKMGISFFSYFLILARKRTIKLLEQLT